MKSSTLKMEDLIGLTTEEASKLIKSNNMHSRLVCKDGKHFIYTMEFRMDRVNLTVEKDKVVKADIG